MFTLFAINRQLETTGEGGTPTVNKPLGSLFDDNKGFGQTTLVTPEEEAAQLEVQRQAAAKTATPDAAVITAETTELTTLLEKDTHTEVEKKRLDELKSKYNVEEQDADGKPLTPEVKKAINDIALRLKEINAKPEAQRTVEELKFLQDNTPVAKKSIYEQVDEVTGAPLEIDYKGIDPLSVEGVILREETIADRAAEEYDAELKSRFPRPYQFLMHMQAGGKEEDFFNAINNDFSKINLTKTDTASQESVYRTALSIKGNSPAQIDLLVTAAKDKGKLFEEAKVELDALQARQRQEETRREQAVQQEQVAKTNLVNGFINSLTSLIDKGINGVAIPVNDRKAFASFVTSHCSIVNGKIVFAKVLEPNNLVEELAANYFRFKKGDLSKVVANKAASIVADNARKAIKFKITPKGGQEQEVKKVKFSEL